jgi:hypothetical protein
MVLLESKNAHRTHQARFVCGAVGFPAARLQRRNTIYGGNGKKVDTQEACYWIARMLAYCVAIVQSK